MAQRNPNLFDSYQLSEQELLLASEGITDLTAMWLQTLAAAALEEKSQLPVNPNNIQEFVQREAYLRGQADAIFTILSARPSISE